MSEDMIERVARAIVNTLELPELPIQQEHREAASAAIEAMREPTPGMLAAAMEEEATDLASEYRAMIDAALETAAEKKEPA